MELSANLVIIVITVIASFYTWNNSVAYHRWIFHPYTVFHKKEYHRFVTSGFMHADYMHLFFNMFTLYFFGTNIEYIFREIHGSNGVIIFVAFYLLAIIISDIPTFLKYKNLSHYYSLGASGGVSAIVFSNILFLPLEKIYLFGIIGIPGFILGILYLMYSYYQGKRMGDNINHDAHLYGAIFGIVFTIVIWPRVVPLFIEQMASFRLF